MEDIFKSSKRSKTLSFKKAETSLESSKSETFPLMGYDKTLRAQPATNDSEKSPIRKENQKIEEENKMEFQRIIREMLHSVHKFYPKKGVIQMEQNTMKNSKIEESLAKIRSKDFLQKKEKNSNKKSSPSSINETNHPEKNYFASLKISIAGKEPYKDPKKTVNDYLRDIDFTKNAASFSLCVFVYGVVDAVNTMRKSLLACMPKTVATLMTKNANIALSAFESFIVPMIFMLLVDEADSIKIVAAITAGKVVSDCLDILEGDDYNAVYQILLDYFLPMILALFNESFEKVKKSALSVIVIFSKYLRTSDLNKYVLPQIIFLSHENDLQKNIIAIKLIDVLVIKFGHETCEVYLFNEFRHLALGPPQVQRILAKHFCNLYITLTKQSSRDLMFNLYSKFCSGKNRLVKNGALSNMCNFAKCATDANGHKRKLLEIYKGFLEEKDYSINEIALMIFGEMVVNYSSLEITPKLVKKYTNCFKVKNDDLISMCAKDFYWVAKTVGRSRWGEISEAYIHMTQHEKESIRLVSVQMAQKLAKLIGTENSSISLFAPFKKFLNDTEKIKTEAVKKFSELASFLNVEQNKELLDMFLKLVQSDADQWRLRYFAAQEMVSLINMFGIKTIEEKVMVLCIELASDPVYTIRVEASKNLAFILKLLGEKGETDIFEILARNINLLAISEYFLDRQIFIKICENLLTLIDVIDFKKYFWEKINVLSTDRIVNVRISLAKLLKRKWNIINKAFESESNRLLELMRADPDFDVRNEVDF